MDHGILWTLAHTAGEAAAKAVTPKPMHIVRTDLAGNVLRRYEPIMEGMCGFAYVKIRPANSSFARWLKANNVGHKAYGGGWEVSVHEYGQSWERKRAHAQAAAAKLREHGITATAYDRLD